MEQAQFRQLFSAAGKGCKHSEEIRRGAYAWNPDRSRQDSSKRGENGA